MTIDFIGNGNIVLIVLGLLSIASLALIRFQRTRPVRRALSRHRRQGGAALACKIEAPPEKLDQEIRRATFGLEQLPAAVQSSSAVPLAVVPAGQRTVPTQGDIVGAVGTTHVGNADPEVLAAIPAEVPPSVKRARIRRINDPRERRDVEFYVLYSKLVSARAPFTIYVTVAGFTPIGPHEKATTQETPESFVTSIPEGARIGIFLDGDQIEIDAPEQALVWRSRAAMAAFVLHPKKREGSSCAHCKVSVQVDGIDCGRIFFEVDMDSEIVPVLANPRIADKDSQPVTSWNHQVPALLTTEGSKASTISGFFCYSHRDWSWVSYVGDDLSPAISSRFE